MNLVITVCATKAYTYAMPDQVHRIQANLAGRPPGHIVLVGDTSSELSYIRDLYRELLPEGWKIHLAADTEINDGDPKYINYKEEAQLLIGKMRETAFAFARKLNADLVWSLDSDVLPPHNALKCMEQMLEFDDGYYGVAMCPYPNHEMLGGRGTPVNIIAEDFLPEERKLPNELKIKLESSQKTISTLEVEMRQAAKMQMKEEDASVLQKRIEEAQKDHSKIMEEVKKCPPDGNIWEVIAKHGWRRRGWLSHAYPAIGRGSIVPTDWVGFGCTLISKRALATISFANYEGKGTEDINTIRWNWLPEGIRMCVLPHALCGHVIWSKKKTDSDTKKEDIEKAKSEYYLLDSYHELEGECVGHIRVRRLPYKPFKLPKDYKPMKHESPN